MSYQPNKEDYEAAMRENLSLMAENKRLLSEIERLKKAESEAFQKYVDAREALIDISNILSNWKII